MIIGTGAWSGSFSIWEQARSQLVKLECKTGDGLAAQSKRENKEKKKREQNIIIIVISKHKRLYTHTGKITWATYLLNYINIKIFTNKPPYYIQNFIAK